MKKLLNIISKLKTKGFVLPLTLLVCSIILTIATGISIILTKELYFSKLSRESQLAYYAADNAMMCAIMIDDQYIDPIEGIGIFPYNGLRPSASEVSTDMDAVLAQVNLSRQNRGQGSIVINDIRCATSAIFDNQLSGFTTVAFNHANDDTSPGIKTGFSMKMDLGNGTQRCANVIIYKTKKYRQIIARGFASCAGTAHPIERAIVNTTEIK
ncbi:MAG: hypothetical protein EXS50_02535 [Candidatus Taylorbacteria bacterium]|nr:hypothetical protein [Candidatus Taylorbacteria bacterium]